MKSDGVHLFIVSLFSLIVGNLIVRILSRIFFGLPIMHLGKDGLAPKFPIMREKYDIGWILLMGIICCINVIYRFLK